MVTTEIMNYITNKNIIIIVLLGVIVGLFAALYNVTKNSVPLSGVLIHSEEATTIDIVTGEDEEIISTNSARTTSPL